MAKGMVYLVGAGPGDPGLLTLTGCEVLERADVVVHDHLVSQGVLAFARQGAKRVYVGKESSRHAVSQSKINLLLIREANAGKVVARLKGGDPFLFGRGAEEASALTKAGIAFEVVPGVSSALAVPAYAGIPLTHRMYASSVAVLTGHEDPSKADERNRWAKVATACDTLVFLMGIKALPRIAKQLMESGRSSKTPVAVIEQGTRPSQRTTMATLGTVVAKAREARVKPPAIIVVGDVVRLRKNLEWFEKRSLFSRRILVTRSVEKAGSLAKSLRALGADVEELPAIQCAPVKATNSFRKALKEIPKTDWVFFTSPEGIGWFSRMLKPQRKDVHWLSGCHIAAIGPKTASALEEVGLHVDYVPRRFSQEGLLEDLPACLTRGKRAIILSAQDSRDLLEEGLKRRGITVKKVPVYRTIVPSQLSSRIQGVFAKPFDFVMVTSASCVEHLRQALRQVGWQGRFKDLQFASIGPVTSSAVRALGGRVVVEAKTSTIEGLMDAMSAYKGHGTKQRKRSK